MKNKLDKLIEAEGAADVGELCNRVTGDSLMPGICMNKNCNKTTDVEPDSDDGWCDECGTGTVESLFNLLLRMKPTT